MDEFLPILTTSFESGELSPSGLIVLPSLQSIAEALVLSGFSERKAG